jgi:hypothetical protein
MNLDETRTLESAVLWAIRDDAPVEAKVLLKEITRREVDHSGLVGWLYECPPEDRVHRCVDRNDAGLSVAWVEYDPQYGFCLMSTNVYGDGAYADIAYCPFCGEKLEPPVGEGV